jgi:hypothetical protein
VLRVPPHRPASTVGIHDDRRMSAVGHRGTIGMVQKLTGMRVASMPAVDDQRGRPRAEIVNILVKRIKLIRDRLPRELQHLAAEPVSCAAQPAVFTRSVVDRAVRQSIHMSRC